MIDTVKLKNNYIKLSTRLNIDSIIVEQNGLVEQILLKKDSLHEVRSGSKLLIALAIGKAIDDKMLVNGTPISLDTKIYPIIEKNVKIDNEKNLEKIKKWTIRNLLTHTTGYEKQMLSQEYIKDIEKKDLLNYALNYEMKYPVGERYAYNNVEPFILSVFFQEAFGKNIADFINENIFSKMDINEYKWDNFGKYCAGATGLYLKPSDFHKLGKLLLNDGKYNNIQIISEDWIVKMCNNQIDTTSLYKKERVLPKMYGGYYTFISRDNFVFRDGARGQYIIINKKANLAITIMSNEEDMKNITEILRGVI